MNICNCPNPPGGDPIICESNQIAICRIIDGRTERRCINLLSANSAVELVNWTLIEITGHWRSLTERISDSEIALLYSGRLETYEQVTHFSLPPAIKEALEKINNNMGMSSFEEEMGAT